MTMFVLISHAMTDTQKQDARQRFGVEKFVTLPSEEWSQIPADAASVAPLLQPLFERLAKEAQRGDLLFVQGDFGATCVMVQWAFANGLVPVYATTKREAVETVEGDRIVTTRTFRHVRFRAYERIG